MLAWNWKLHELGPSWRAANGEGVPGTFVATKEYELGPPGGGRKARVLEGTFVSDDASVMYSDVELANAPGDLELGMPMPALDTGVEGVVYPAGAAYSFATNLMCLSCLGCPLVLLMLLALRSLLRRLRGPSVEDRRTPEA